ncbi:hypothetical protein ACFQ51_52610 [Streptomyces kaempferi]
MRDGPHRSRLHRGRPPARLVAAEEQAQQFRDQGIPVTVVMDQDSDRYLIVPAEGGQR